MEERNLMIEVINDELGHGFSGVGDVTVSSPFRRDSNPSLRVYAPKGEEGDLGSCYDWGAGESYTPVGFIMELMSLSFRDALDYIRVNYNIELSDHKHQGKDNGLSDKLIIIRRLSSPSPGEVEKAISGFMSKEDPSFINKLMADIESVNI